MMRILVRMLVCVAFSVVHMSNAHANWIFQKGESSAFESSSGVHMALTLARGMAFGLRCQDSLQQAAFVTNDKSFDGSEESLRFANISVPLLLVRIDDYPAHEIKAELQLTQDGDAMVIAPADGTLLSQLSGAKKRISVALKLLGKVYHETKFSVRGSTRAVEQFQNHCK